MKEILVLPWLLRFSISPQYSCRLRIRNKPIAIVHIACSTDAIGNMQLCNKPVAFVHIAYSRNAIGNMQICNKPYVWNITCCMQKIPQRVALREVSVMCNA